MLQAVSSIHAVDTDVEMPRGSMNGFELARQIRAKRQEVGGLIASGRAAPKPSDLPDGALFTVERSSICSGAFSVLEVTRAVGLLLGRTDVPGSSLNRRCRR